jgi:hypothetical protein
MPNADKYGALVMAGLAPATHAVQLLDAMKQGSCPQSLAALRVDLKTARSSRVDGRDKRSHDESRNVANADLDPPPRLSHRLDRLSDLIDDLADLILADNQRRRQFDRIAGNADHDVSLME